MPGTYRIVASGTAIVSPFSDIKSVGKGEGFRVQDYSTADERE
jgi:hypothetical protein